MRMRSLGAAALLALTALTGTAAGQPATTAFTYQGRLTAGGVGQSALYDLQFKLYDAATAGNQLGSTVALLNTQVSGGLFSVSLDFGPQFNSSRRWLEIAVRPAGGGSYTTLSPRQELTAAPHAEGLVLPLTAAAATAADGFEISNAGGGNAIRGDASAGIFSAGMYGNSSASNGNGVIGHADVGGSAYGVWGNAAQGLGVVGNGGTAGGQFTGGTGVWGISTLAGASGYGVLGQSGAGSVGVRGESSAGGLDSFGGYFVSTVTNGTGVFGRADVGGGANAVWGNAALGSAVSGGGGLWGGSFVGKTGVYAQSTLAGPQGYGILAEGGYGNVGCLAESSAGGGGSYGLYADSIAAQGNGIYGECNNGTAAYAIWGRSTSGYAGFFSGNVQVAGTLSKSGGSFKIDHPLDPANKYLYHSFVESPDMMNVYNGNAITDAGGYATILLPEWFQTLNRDFRYQLTVMDEANTDEFVQAKIVRGVGNNQFTIRTSAPRVTVSWQVTGIRQDPWANVHRIPVEEAKNDLERGRFIHPELYGMPASASLEGIKGAPMPPVRPDVERIMKGPQPLPAIPPPALKEAQP